MQVREADSGAGPGRTRAVQVVRAVQAEVVPEAGEARRRSRAKAAWLPVRQEGSPVAEAEAALPG